MNSRLSLRLFTASMGVIVAVSLGAPAAMAATRTIEWINPTADDPVLRKGKIGVMTFNDDGRSTDKIEISIENSLPAGDPCTPSPLVSSVKPPTGTRGSVPFEAEVVFPCNGAFSVVATAWNTRQGLDFADPWSNTLPMKVAIPPSSVTGLTSLGWKAPQGDAKTGNIELKWNANTELDLIGYRIDRSINDQSLTNVAEISKDEPTSYVDSELPIESAKYSYRVVAIRKGATAEERITSTDPVVIAITAGKPSGPIEGTPETTVPPKTTNNSPTTQTHTPSSSSAQSSSSSDLKPTSPAGSSIGLNRTIDLPAQSSDEPAPESNLPTAEEAGYADRLPYASLEGVEDGLSLDEGSLEELGAGESTAKRRAVLIPIATGLILAMGWTFLRIIRREMAHADAAESISRISEPRWSPDSDDDDTGPVLPRRELQSARRAALKIHKRGV